MLEPSDRPPVEDAGGAMADLIPVLIGTKGLADGEVYPLPSAGELVLGRSRLCSVSFQRFRRFLSLSADEQKLRDSYNSAVSRRHLLIRATGVGRRVTLENLSKGGSWCDDQRFDGLREVDLAQRAVVLRLGQAVETFQLTLLDRAAVAALLARLGTPLPPLPAPQPGVPDPVEDPTPEQNQAQPSGALTPNPGHAQRSDAARLRPPTPPPDLEASRYV
jgi:hypothetical protein